MTMKKGCTAINNFLNLGVLTIVVVLSAGFLFLGFSTIAQDLRLEKEGVVAVATITNHQEVTGNNSQENHLVRYQFTVDGARYTYTDSMGRRNLWHLISEEEWNSLRKTNQIKVVYLPSDPWINRPLGKNSMFDSYAAVCAGTGGVILLCFLPVKRLASRKKVTNLIKDALRRIQHEGGDGNFVTFTLNRTYYIQFTGEAGRTRLYAEAVGNDSLKPREALSNRQIALLRSLGWNPPEEWNFYREWQTSTDRDRERVAQEVVRTFVKVYGLQPDDKIEVNLVLQ